MPSVQTIRVQRSLCSRLSSHPISTEVSPEGGAIHGFGRAPDLLRQPVCQSHLHHGLRHNGPPTQRSSGCAGEDQTRVEDPTDVDRRPCRPQRQADVPLLVSLSV